MNTQQPILLIGDSCLDVFVYGEVKRLNPEAPVPILDYKRTEVREGMCLNVYNNLKAFGFEVILLTNKEKIVKTRYIDEKTNQQILRVDDDVTCQPLSEKINVNDYKAIVISDYDKGFITTDFIFELTKDTSTPIFIDSKKTHLPNKKCYIKINDLEKLKLVTNNTNTITTLGSRGAEYNNVIYPAEKVKVYDVVGAGDTFLAGLVYGYLTYGTIEKAISIANKAAAIAVSNPGTYVLKEEDVKNICN